MSEESQRAYLLREEQTAETDFLNSLLGEVDTVFYLDFKRFSMNKIGFIALDTCIQSHHKHNIRNLYECLLI